MAEKALPRTKILVLARTQPKPYAFTTTSLLYRLTHNLSTILMV